MTALITRSQISRSVWWRLVAGLLPTVVAVGLVVGLFYYGKMDRRAPGIVLILAVVLTAASLIITWRNERYFANRIGRLAKVMGDSVPTDDPRGDDFDLIEAAVGTLGTALSKSEAERARADATAEAHRRDEATMLAGTVSDTLAQLDQLRMPLHILLEAPFGELNENQEELLRDARAAADSIDTAIRRLGQVADADRGAMVPQKELVQVNDVVRSILPLARAAADRRGARVEASLEPGLPRVMADRARLAEALSLLVAEVASESSSEKPLSLSTTRETKGITLHITPAPRHDTSRTPPTILAERLITAQGGEITSSDGSVEIRMSR